MKKTYAINAMQLRHLTRRINSMIDAQSRICTITVTAQWCTRVFKQGPGCFDIVDSGDAHTRAHT